MSSKINFFLFLAGALVQLSCNKESASINPVVTNSGPAGSTTHALTANAGTDQIVTLSNNHVSLDGFGSCDQQDNVASYQWTVLDGPGTITIKDPSSPVTSLSGFSIGNYRLKLRVTDKYGDIAGDTTEIQVIDNNLSGFEYSFHSFWGYNDVRDDNDVYLLSARSPDLFSDPDVPLEVSILSDTSSTWVSVPRFTNSLPSNTMYYYRVEYNLVSIWASFPGCFNHLIGKEVQAKFKFL